MSEVFNILKNVLLISQLISVIICLLYLFKREIGYWRWFAVYLVIIFIQECFWMQSASIDKQYRIIYYVFIGVPLEYLFFYWLYALKSQKNKKLFILSVSIYIITILLSVFYKNVDEVFSISVNIGTMILIVLIILEFIKQIKTDDILMFKANRMFYINLGLILFYIGNYPFHIFGPELYINHLNIWNAYYFYFLITNILMYVLFSVAFIWGKTR